MARSKTNIDIFKNPASSESKNAINSGKFENARIGIDRFGTLYAWIDNVPHLNISKALGKKFILRFAYNNGYDLMFTDMSSEEFNQNINDKILRKIKDTFPFVNKIEQIQTPFLTLFVYKEKS